LIAARGCGEFEAVVGEGDKALVRIGPRSREVYNFRTVLNAGDPMAVNAARREALLRLAGPAR